MTLVGEVEDLVAEYLPDGKEVRYVADSVQSRPQRAVQIASVAAVWALIENDLSLIYGYLLGTTLPQPPNRSHPPLHPVGLQVFEALHALNNRIKLLNDLAKWQATAEEKGRIEELTKQVSKASNLRSRIVHGMWGICDDYPDDLILHGTLDDQRPRLYREHDLEQVHKTLIDLHESVYTFILSIHRRMAPKR